LKTAYFILGMHRSGTSALGGVLNIMGLEFGSDLMKANQANSKGYFENNFVYILNEKILSESNSSWDDYHFNINKISKDKKKIYIEEAKAIIKKEFRYSKSFVIKDPRICLLFPLWETACLELGIKIKIIIPFRNPMEVASSLRKRNSLSIEKSLILWTHHFLSAEYYSKNYNRLFISFDHLLEDTKKVVDRLYDFINFKGQKKRKEIESFLDANIKYNNMLLENFTKETPQFLQQLVRLLKESNFDNLDHLDEIRNDFYFSLEMFQHEEIRENILDKNKRTLEITTQNKNLEDLNNKVNLLNAIKDIAKVDEDYYKQRYPDLKKYKGILSEHYYKYGKSEGRIPNEYCDFYDIQTKEKFGNDELLYQTKIELTEQKDINREQKIENEKKIRIKLDEIALLEQSLGKQKDINREQKLKNEKKIKVGLAEIALLNQKMLKEKEINKEQKLKNEKKINVGLAEIALLNQKILKEKEINKKQKIENEQKIKIKLDEIALLEQDIVKQKEINKEEKIKNEKEIKTGLEEISLLNQSLVKQKEITREVKMENKRKITIRLDEISLLNQNLIEEKEINQQQKREKEKKIQQGLDEILLLNEKINLLEEKENSLEKILQKREKELKNKLKNIKLLRNNLNEVLEDLVSIKESKCWIYTKPIRDFEKVLKG